MEIPDIFMADDSYKASIPDAVINKITVNKLKKCKRISEKLRDYYEGSVGDDEINEVVAEKDYLIDTFIFLAQINGPKTFKMHDYKAMVRMILDYSDLKDLEKERNEDDERS